IGDLLPSLALSIDPCPLSHIAKPGCAAGQRSGEAMASQQLVDLVAGGAALEPRDDAPAVDQDERGELADAEPADQVGPVVAVDLDDAEPGLLRDLHPRDEALHPARR